MRAWACISLIAWATLDQRAGKFAKAKKLRTRNCRDASSIVLGWILDQKLKAQSKSRHKTDINLGVLIELFLHLGGFSIVGESRSAKSMLKQLQSELGDLGYVHALADFMIRYHDHHLSSGSKPKRDVNFSIESAIAYITEFRPADWKEIDRSSMLTIWRKYKASAPFIHAGFPILRDWVSESSTSKIKTLALSQFFPLAQIQKVFGEAAYCADVLHYRVRGLKMNDFADINRVRPASAPFSSEHMTFVNKIERNF